MDSLQLSLLGLLLQRPRDDWRQEVGRLASEAEDHRLAGAAAAALGAAEPDYHALLGPGGSVSPRHAAYIGMEDPGKRLNRLMELFQAYGYHPARGEDPPDHVAVEVGFAAFLSLKLAHAVASDDEEAALAAAGAREMFIQEHLGPLVRAMLPKVEQAPTAPPYIQEALSELALRVGPGPEEGTCPAS